MGIEAGGILGGLGAVIKAGTGIYQNILANKINPVYTPYQISQSAKQRLGLASSMFNGRMPSSGLQERRIMAASGSAYGNLSRNATDASQQLSLAAGVQGQENQAFDQLGIRESENQMALLDNLNSAYGVMTNEDTKVYQDKMNKYQMDVNTQNQLRGAGVANAVGGINDAASLFTQYDRLNKMKKYGGGMIGGMGMYGGSGYGE
jgi:hypothetical protein